MRMIRSNKSGTNIALSQRIIHLHSSLKLQAFIITSNTYRVQSILNRITSIPHLRREVALLHGKVNSPNKSLAIILVCLVLDASIRTSLSNPR